MLVLTWNLYHGRAQPPAGRELLAEFAGALDAWAWDVALLQEVPPWWPQALAAATDAEQRTVLTSRNSALALRRALARRRPDLMKSAGGGANTILVRGPAIGAHRAHRLRRWPERRLVHAVDLEGVWVANLHAQSHPQERARADDARAAAVVQEWAAGRPCVLGGDFNVRHPEVEGLTVCGGHHVDHVLAGGLVAAAPAEVLDRGRLSDHAPVRVALREGTSSRQRP